MSSRAFTGLLGAEASADLLRARGALQTLGEDVRQRTFSAASQQLSAGWMEELAARPGHNPAQKKIVTADPRVVAHPLSLTAETGGSGKLAALTRPMEFGTLNQEEFVTYTRRGRNGGASHTVTRRTKRQMPTRSQTGWIAYPTGSKWAKRAFAMYLQIIVKVAHDAADGGLRG